MRAPLVAISRRVKFSNMTRRFLIPPRLRGGWPSGARSGGERAILPMSPTRRARARHPPRRRGGISSIRRCPARLDRAGPFLAFALYEIPHISRLGSVAGDDLGPEPFEALLHQRVMHRLQGRLVELLDDRLRRVLGQEDRVTRIGFRI